MDSSHQLSNLVSQRHDVKHLEVAADEPVGHDLELNFSRGVAPNEEVGPGEPWSARVVKLANPEIVMTDCMFGVRSGDSMAVGRTAGCERDLCHMQNVGTMASIVSYTNVDLGSPQRNPIDA
jgi:hypothetical protein